MRDARSSRNIPGNGLFGSCSHVCYFLNTVETINVKKSRISDGDDRTGTFYFEMTRPRIGEPKELGYWTTVGIMFWAGIVALGALGFAVAFGMIGFAAWLALNLVLVYPLSQARNHWRKGVFDDHLTGERMRSAEEDVIKIWEEKQEKK